MLIKARAMGNTKKLYNTRQKGWMRLDCLVTQRIGGALEGASQKMGALKWCSNIRKNHTTTIILLFTFDL